MKNRLLEILESYKSNIEINEKDFYCIWDCNFVKLANEIAGDFELNEEYFNMCKKRLEEVK